MSLILEALRKSEAERRLGSAPNVLTAMPVLRAPPPRKYWPLWLAGSCALLAALALGWWWMRAPPNAPAQPVATPPQAASRADTNAAAGTLGDAQRPQNPPTITLPVTAAPQAAAPIHPAAATPMPQATAAAPRTSIDTTALAHPQLPAPTEPAPPAAVAGTTVPPPAPAMPASHSVDADEPALMPLADLSADERNSLPALKVSMHVYADDPSHRFMIIDGQRVGEGARIADGVILVRIRHDGAEIDAHGRRLLLPKP